ncbi:MAG: ComEA family DNA-binding protein [Propionibacteriaceae bacterium]|nr:ComEA family DNA-binding protein [Propionibacteriaceae bacterium]
MERIDEVLRQRLGPVLGPSPRRIASERFDFGADDWLDLPPSGRFGEPGPAQPLVVESELGEDDIPSRPVLGSEVVSEGGGRSVRAERQVDSRPFAGSPGPALGGDAASARPAAFADRVSSADMSAIRSGRSSRADPVSTAGVQPGRPGQRVGGSTAVGGVVRQVWEFTRGHLAAVGTVLLAGVLWAGYSMTQAHSSQLPLSVSTTAPPGSASAQPTPLGAESSTAAATPVVSAEPAMVMVHVLGAVKSPGVVEVVEGSRVQDAIDKAGGLAADADPAELNLAAKVADGTQIVIGTKRQPAGEVRVDQGGAQAGVAGGSASAPARISLNSATAAELETIPGIGPVTAAKILAWRQAHGKFSDPRELLEVSGIGEKTYAEMEPYVQL